MTTPAWQHALDPHLVRRLRRRADRQGVTEPRQARAILARNLGMTGGLPLLEQLGPRGEAGSDTSLPLVFAQPRPTPVAEPTLPAAPVVRPRANGDGPPPRAPISSAPPMVIQRKIDPTAAPAPALPDPLPPLLAPPPDNSPMPAGPDRLPVVPPVPAATDQPAELPVVPAATVRPGAELPLAPSPGGAEGLAAGSVAGLPVVPVSGGAGRPPASPAAGLPVVPVSGGAEGPGAGSAAELPVVPVSGGAEGLGAGSAAVLPVVPVSGGAEGPGAGSAAGLPVVPSPNGGGRPSAGSAVGLPLVTVAPGVDRHRGELPMVLPSRSTAPPAGRTVGALPLVREQVIRQQAPGVRLPVAPARGPAAATAAQPAGTNGSSGAASVAAPPKVDIDHIVDTVHRRFLRRLAVEGERRGVR